MRNAITFFAAWLLLAAVAFGVPPLTITDSGYFVTVVDADGVPSMVRIESVVDLRTGKHAPPKDKPDAPKPPAGISADAATWASEIGQPTIAQKYALIFEVARDGVIDAKVNSGNLFDVLRQSADEIVPYQWEPFRRKLGESLTAKLQEGKLDSKAEIADVLERVRYGLVYSAREQPPMSGGDAAQVVAKVNSVIEGEQ